MDPSEVIEITEPVLAVEQAIETAPDPGSFLGVEELDQIRASLTFGLSQDLLAVRKGAKGFIREELEPNDVAAVLNQQLMHFTQEEIAAVIRCFPETEQQKAIEVLHHISGFASLEGMNALTRAIDGDSNAPVPPVDSVSLAENLKYLTGKRPVLSPKVFTKEDSDLIATGPKVLDQRLLYALESNKDIAREVARSDAPLLHPLGFSTGLGVFSFSTLTEIRDRLTEVVERVNQLTAEDPGLSIEHATYTALQEPIEEQLRYIEQKHGLEDQLLPKLRSVLPDDEMAPASLASITRRLNGATGISEEELAKTLEPVPEIYQAAIKESLVRDGRTLSCISLVESLRAVKQHLENHRALNGVKPEDVRYVVTEGTKSWGLITMAFALANDIPQEQLVDLSGARYNREIGKRLKGAKAVVLLDDYAGSGQSFERSVQEVRDGGWKGSIVIAPVVANRKSVQAAGGIREIMSRDTKVDVAITETTETGNDSPYIKSLSDKDQKILKIALGNAGWHSTRESIVFPYMNPDNCYQFWGTNIAPKFTLNGKGCESGNYCAPNESPIDRALLENQVNYAISESSELSALPVAQRLPELVENYLKLSSLTRMSRGMQLPATDDAAQVLEGVVTQTTEVVEELSSLLEQNSGSDIELADLVGILGASKRLRQIASFDSKFDQQARTAIEQVYSKSRGQAYQRFDIALDAALDSTNYEEAGPVRQLVEVLDLVALSRSEMEIRARSAPAVTAASKIVDKASKEFKSHYAERAKQALADEALGEVIEQFRAESRKLDKGASELLSRKKEDLFHSSHDLAERLKRITNALEVVAQYRKSGGLKLEFQFGNATKTLSDELGIKNGSGNSLRNLLGRIFS